MRHRGFTQTSIAALKVPSAGPDGRPAQADYRDPGLPGFGVRVTSNGTRTYFLLRTLNGDRKRWTLGRVGDVSLADAREIARQYGAVIAKGIDPEAEAKRAAAAERTKREAEDASTFAAVRERYLAQYKKRSATKVARFLRGPDLAEWNDRPLASLTRREIVERFDAIAERAPIWANRGLSHFKSMVSWALDKSLLEVDIAARVRKPAEEGERNRVLSDAEIRALWVALDDSSTQFAGIVRVLLLTGCRREEVAQLTWREVTDLYGAEPRIELGADRTKNGRAHLVPLSSAAVEIIRAQAKGAPSDFVFAGPHGGQPWDFNGAKAKLDARLKFEAPWVIHDLRRTATTHMNEIGVLPHVVEAILNHASGVKAGVAGIYNRAHYLGERRVALQRWADHIVGLVEGRAASNVVPLRA